MKQSDIFTIIIIASVGMVGAFFASNALLGNPDDLSLKHKTISQIVTEVVAPDEETFNRAAINPTVEVYVGECEDVDQNGILDRAELAACGKAAPEQTEEEKNKEKDKEKVEVKQDEANSKENAASQKNEKTTTGGASSENSTSQKTNNSTTQP